MSNLKTIKCQLTSILKPGVNYTKFVECITKANNIYLSCSMFIRSYYIHIFDKNEVLPNLDSNFIRIAFKVLSKDSRGPKLGKINKEIYDNLNEYYNSTFKNILPNYDKYDASNLSNTIKMFATQMEVSYTNNIVMNFSKYVFQYVNQQYIESNFKKISKEDKHNLSKEQLANIRKHNYEENIRISEIKKGLYDIKNDLINNTLNSDMKHHDFIKETKELYFPELDQNSKSLVHDVEKYPFKYLKHMMLMNKKLETTKNKKLFQPLCVRTECTNMYVPFDSSAIKDIFNMVHSNMTQEQLWNDIFNIKTDYKNYNFNFLISTDGYAVSLSLINEKGKENKDKLNNARIDGRKLSDKEIKLKKENKTNKTYRQNKADKIQDKRDEYSKLSLEQQNEIKSKMKKKRNKCEYIENIIKNNIDDLTGKNIVVADPGLRSQITLLGQSNNDTAVQKFKVRFYDKSNDDIPYVSYSYRRKRRFRDSGQMKSRTLRENKINKTKINGKSLKEHESELCIYNKKTMDLESFNKYAALRIKLRDELTNEKKYIDYFSKSRWNSYVNMEQHESKILNEIQDIYGKNAVIVLGDWSKSKNIKYMSTPTIGTRKWLMKRFPVYLIDEFCTSKYFGKSDEIIKGEKFKMKNIVDEKVEVVTKHSVLTFQMGKEKKECIIDRDYNSTICMMKIVKSLLSTGKKPKMFMRKTNHKS